MRTPWIVLALALATPMADAVAANVPKIKNIRIRQNDGSGGTPNYRLVASDPAPAVGVRRVAKIVVIVKNDDTDEVGREVVASLPLDETGTIAHSRVQLGAYPAAGTPIAFDVFGPDGKPLGGLKGTVDREGSLSGVGGAFADCVDLAGLALDSQGGVVVNLEHGLCEIGKVTVTVTEAGKANTFPAPLSTATRFEAALDGPLPEGAVVRWVEIDPDTREREVSRIRPWTTEAGRTITTVPWNDPGFGTAFFSVSGPFWGSLPTEYGDWRMTVATPVPAGMAVPAVAEFVLPTGEGDAFTNDRWDAPLSSVQQIARVPVTFGPGIDPRTAGVGLAINTTKGDPPPDLSTAVDMVGGGFCVALSPEARAGGCFHLVEGDKGAWTLDITTYAPTEADLPASLDVSLTDAKGNPLTVDKAYTATFGADRFATYSHGFDFDSDPAGALVDLRVRLRAASTGRTRGEVVARAAARGTGTKPGPYTASSTGGVCVNGACSRTVEFAGFDARDATEFRGDVLIGGEPIGIERPVEGGGTVLTVPDVIQAANGRGTRNTTEHTSQTQQTSLL